MTYRGDKTKCSHCGGGVFYGEHHPGCPKNIHAKARPSESGYGVFLHQPNQNGFVVRAIDTLAAPYKVEDAVRVYKLESAARKYADKLNSGEEALKT